MVALIAAGTALVLGYVGYRAVPHNAYSPTDAVYWSISLFAERVGPTPGGTPVAVDIGRFLALGVIAYAAFAAAALVLRDRTDAWRVRHFARRHVIVAGTGSAASAAVDALRSAADDVLVIDAEPGSREGLGMRAAGARVIAGDATQPSIAAAARVGTAKLVIVITGEDERNLEILAAAASGIEPEASRTPAFHVAIDDVDAWRELSHAALAGGARVATEFFNLADRAALALLSAGARLSGAYAPSRVLIDGDGPVAVRTVVHLVRRALLEGRRAEILLAGHSGSLLHGQLLSQEPWCLDAADVRSADGGGHRPLVAIVCGARTDAVALSSGVALARTGAGEHILVAVARAKSAEGLRLVGLAPPALHVVVTGVETLARELLERSGTEIIARAKHEDYVRRELERGESPQTNASLVEWERLPESLKEANRRFAESVGAHVAALGAEIRPLAHAPATTELAIERPALDELARGEHERWISSLQHDGWTRTSGPKDAVAKRHPLLVPWDELPESEREKDRDAFRNLPQMLGLVGYELVPPPP